MSIVGYPRFDRRANETSKAPTHARNGANNRKKLISLRKNEAFLKVVSYAGDEMNLSTMIKRPSAFVPVAMSLAALAIVLVHIIRSGVAREADEGTAAHLWQLLMAAQIPIVAFFAVRWLPQSPRLTLPVLALQAVAALVALAPVYLLNL
jgi:hypothetical protein